MLIISCQYHISVPILMKKLREGKNRRIAVQMLAPDVGICVDGHHDYVASKVDRKPLTIVTASMDISEGLTGSGLLDYWDKQKDCPDKTEEWQFYELFTGKPVPTKTLRNIIDNYPDYQYSV
jgi:hypothetical protein